MKGVVVKWRDRGEIRSELNGKSNYGRRGLRFLSAVKDLEV